jgi:hypothetical protein
MMKNLLAVLSFLLLSLSCNDGDIIVTSFDFDDEDLELCGDSDTYVFFKINNTGLESISLQIQPTGTLFLESGTTSFTLNTTANFVNYRKYDGDLSSDYFCSSIPPTSPVVTLDYLGTSGTAVLITETTLDDNDNLVEVEDDSIDTDGDGIPNYYDYDDDGDNVPTAAEIGLDPLNPRDSDGDSIPDYLDDDDDNDSILTRNEDLNNDLNPANDISDPSVGPDYLNAAITTETIVNAYRSHTYNLSSDIQLQLENLVLVNSQEQITQEFLDLGQKANVVSGTVTVTPDF